MRSKSQGEGFKILILGRSKTLENGTNDHFHTAYSTGLVLLKCFRVFSWKA